MRLARDVLSMVKMINVSLINALAGIPEET
jgi:hypothetical protein